jgi:hypothetical protein
MNYSRTTRFIHSTIRAGQIPAQLFGAIVARVEAVARSERRELARVLGSRRQVKRRWVVEAPAPCLLRPNHERWYVDDDDDEEVDYRTYYADLEGCRSAPVVIGQRIIPACSSHLAEWAQLVGLDWAARQGVIPYAADAASRGSVHLFYPRNPLPSRAPAPGSRCHAGSSVYVSSEEFEALTDALLELGAPVARLFTLNILRWRTEDEEEYTQLLSDWYRERNLIAAKPR